MNCGDKKFSISQKCTFLEAVSLKDRIMIFKKRSYRCPDAKEKMLILQVIQRHDDHSSSASSAMAFNSEACENRPDFTRSKKDSFFSFRRTVS